MTERWAAPTLLVVLALACAGADRRAGGECYTSLHVPELGWRPTTVCRSENGDSSLLTVRDVVGRPLVSERELHVPASRTLAEVDSLENALNGRYGSSDDCIPDDPVGGVWLRFERWTAGGQTIMLRAFEGNDMTIPPDVGFVMVQWRAGSWSCRDWFSDAKY